MLLLSSCFVATGTYWHSFRRFGVIRSSLHGLVPGLRQWPWQHMNLAGSSALNDQNMIKMFDIKKKLQNSKDLAPGTALFMRCFQSVGKLWMLHGRHALVPSDHHPLPNVPSEVLQAPQVWVGHWFTDFNILCYIMLHIYILCLISAHIYFLCLISASTSFPSQQICPLCNGAICSSLIGLFALQCPSDR
jgi:hypothetical protein